MIVDGEPAVRSEDDFQEPPLPPLSGYIPVAEKPCACHPYMPDVRVPGGFECLGCGWGVLHTFRPEGED